MAIVVAIPTLGCKANRCDSDDMAKRLANAGYKIANHTEPADIFILNTCAVTGDAESKSRKFLRKIIKDNPAALVFVSGCCGVFSPEIGEINGVKKVIPITEQENIADILREHLPPDPIENTDNRNSNNIISSIKRTRAAIKIQDGCDHGCSYCAVTLSRGTMRSTKINEILMQLKELLESGAKEIVLTGIRLDAYGKDINSSLADLLRATIPLNIPRLRLSSVEPLGVTDDFIQACKEHPTLCHHFHLCLQSGDDDVLLSMNRGYTAEEYLTKIRKIKDALPNPTFTTDIIVGYPNESDEAFLNTLKIAREVGFIKMHVFKFSPRKNTAAALLPQNVKPEVKEERSEVLKTLERELFEKAAKTLLQKKVNVIIETKNSGTTDGYFRVSGDFNPTDKGKMVLCRVTEIDSTQNVIKVEII